MNLRKPTILRIVLISTLVSICVAFMLARLSKSVEDDKYKFPAMSKETWEILGTPPQQAEEEEEEEEEEFTPPQEEVMEGYTMF
jgi:hypothetical protein